MNPIKGSLRYPSVVLVLMGMAVAAGMYALMKMQRTEDPTVTIRTGIVLAQYPGATSEQVEKQVTKTLERHILKFPEVRKELTYSTSRPGLVIINVELEDYVKNPDLFWAKLRHEMIETAQTELPSGVRGPIVNSDFGDTVALLVAIHGERYGYRELRDYLDTIQDRFRTVRDVGKMMRYGTQTEEVWITGSLARLSQYFADPVRIIQALEQRNMITDTGKAETERSKIPMKTTGAFTTEDQIANVLVDVSKAGEPVYIKDFAKVERRYEDPRFLVRFDGKPSVLLSVEMQKGKNVTELGDRLDGVMTELRSLLPPDLHVDLIADQPHMVRERIANLGHEFMLAIGSVILVTLLLLPFHVALIAAVAIPVTLTTTIGIMNAVGIPLHQVSIASLIVVLGIVVDDAIVIADNYVELLDHQVAIAEAAWRSATDVFVPVLTATVTIICSFLPLLILTGTAGEFIIALPLTVAIALSVSFIVACMLTPFLCRSFIKKGLRHEEGPAKKRSFNPLDLLQNVYGKAIVLFMRRKGLAMAVGLGAVCAGVFLFKMVPQQFFPSAERNQFVIDVWMRQGTRIEATDAAMGRIEKYLAGRPEVVHYATSVGQSFPRFYYNVNPQQPDGAYGQFIINTRSVKETPVFVDELRGKLAAVVPEAMVIVKELKQGSVEEAPVEIRITGDDIPTLKQIGREVENMLRSVPFSRYVHRDFFNDSYMVDVDLENELANRLGLTHAGVSQTLSGGFDGKPVGTFWEGDRGVTILLRLDKSERSSFNDVSDAYMESQLTHVRVPLRAIADIKPQWQTSRIVRRNGVRTLTVRSFIQRGFYASALLDAVAPKIAALKLPPGYHIYYGGERFNQDDNMPQLVGALAISLVAIFLVLLIQFRNISEPLVVMSSIPLSLLGAAVGLLVTRNPFGFMAFIGMISVCGIVVRNAIILVDYIKEKMAEGHSLDEAATEAGQRRLRPIFLTTMAAAVGVTPMILSRSALWSPLASVIAVGLIFSMFFTLLVVPVLFVVVRSRIKKAPVAALILAAAFLFGSGQAFAETRASTPAATGKTGEKAKRIVDISYNKKDGLSDFNILADGRIGDYEVSQSNSPMQLVVTIRELSIPKPTKLTGIDHPFIKEVRVENEVNRKGVKILFSSSKDPLPRYQIRPLIDRLVVSFGNASGVSEAQVQTRTTTPQKATKARTAPEESNNVSKPKPLVASPEEKSLPRVTASDHGIEQPKGKTEIEAIPFEAPEPVPAVVQKEPLKKADERSPEAKIVETELKAIPVVAPRRAAAMVQNGPPKGVDKRPAEVKIGDEKHPPLQVELPPRESAPEERSPGSVIASDHVSEQPKVKTEIEANPVAAPQAVAAVVQNEPAKGEKGSVEFKIPDKENPPLRVELPPRGSVSQQKSETRTLTLDEAIALARVQNSSLKIADSKVREGGEKRKSVRADYYPHLTNDSTYFHITNTRLIDIPAGSLGTVPGLGPFPTQDTTINQGSNNLFLSDTALTQPLTQLLKTYQADKMALADQQIAAADLNKAKTDVIFATHRLFYGLLIARKQRDAASAAVAAGEQALREAKDSVTAGNVLEVAAIGSSAVLLQNRYALLSAEVQIGDLNSELSDLLGLPLDTDINPVDPPPPETTARSRESFVQEAREKNPEIKAAQEAVKKAESGVKAAYIDYIPDISLSGHYSYQHGAPFLENNIGTFGARMTWNIFDWGKRRAVVAQLKEQLTQANENLRRVEKRVEVEVDKAYRKLEQTKNLISVTRESLTLEKENLRLKGNQRKAGTATEAQYATAVAAVKKAEYEELQALLGYRLAVADLKRIIASSANP